MTLPWRRTSIREAAADRLAPLTNRGIMREAARLLESHGSEVEDAMAFELRGRADAEASRPPAALDLLRRWLNAFDDVERERVEADTRRLLADHAAGRL